VAERLADALFSLTPTSARDALGRWSLAPARDGQRIPVESESVPVPHSVPATVRARRAAATHAYAHDGATTSRCATCALRWSTSRPQGCRGAQRDRVTEIAIVHRDGRAVSACYESLINPDCSIPPAIVALTRITQAMVQDAPRFPEVAPEVVSRLRGRIFVAHNASFDWRFVTHEVQRSAGVLLTGETLCTVRLSRTLLPQLPRRSLDAVTHYFGIDVGARHVLQMRLLQLAEDRGATTCSALLRGPRSARLGDAVA
jgi:DNA polymerase-3 subunit epsilon